ncbi:probable G-protein coupled receptor No18, partial [Argopecten irradians]|uniref:probable G-protein coupled receptor No18 n=1 Tax=Argopecten irradians TaxID=31199 RepID=UPI0037144626
YDSNSFTFVLCYSLKVTINSSSNETFSVDDEDWEDFKKNGIPITVFLIVLSVIGTIGNAHVFLVFLLRYKLNIFKTFVMCLAAVDFLGCSFVIPASLYLIRYSNSIQSSSFCKASLSLSYFTGSYSLLLLDCVAVERYRKVCQTNRKQLTVKLTGFICAFLCCLVIMVIVIPVAILYGSIQTTTETHLLIGFKCDVLDEYKGSTPTIVYRGFVFFLFVLLMFISVVLYTLVGRTVYSHKNKLREANTLSGTEFQPSEFKQGDTSIFSENGGNESSQDILTGGNTNSISEPHVTSYSMFPENSQIMTSCTNGHDVTNNSVAYNRLSTATGNRFLCILEKKKRKSLQKSVNLTMIFLSVSVISFGGYLPFLVIILIKSVNKSLYQNFADNHGALDFFIRWMVFLNNAVNPIVYGLMDKKFRKDISKFYSNMLHGWSVCRK